MIRESAAGLVQVVSPQQADTLRVALVKRLVHLQVLVEDAADP